MPTKIKILSHIIGLARAARALDQPTSTIVMSLIGPPIFAAAPNTAGAKYSIAIKVRAAIPIAPIAILIAPWRDSFQGCRIIRANINTTKGMVPR